MSKQTVRCAVYTRKSTEEGLEQDFNSLDAQREACEAYVHSQKHEGWRLVRGTYDDGGYSGGTIERPGLQLLLEDIKVGRVDVVVVYKIDRLTRSLGDFARMVEVFEVKGVSFVSVTQAFNTTTSMGRLTLNVLLSFAQFEREVTAERIRDKIAASKKKGMWMGGLPPLGLVVKDKQLIVDPAEAAKLNAASSFFVGLNELEIENRKVGKGRPPLHSRFKPGRSGNPKGRPKGIQRTSDLIVKVMSRKVTVREGSSEREVTAQEALLIRLASNAMKGDYRAAALLLNAMEACDDSPAKQIAGDPRTMEQAREIVRKRLEAMAERIGQQEPDP